MLSARRQSVIVPRPPPLSQAYDHLRMNLSEPHCKMLSSHDDYSVVGIMPSGASVLSHLRDPVDRLLSAYEFGIEVRPSSAEGKVGLKG